MAPQKGIVAAGMTICCTLKPGTTTATVLTRAIFSEGCKSVAAGMNPMDLRRGINLAVEKVLEDLKSRAKMISTTEEIAQVRPLQCIVTAVATVCPLGASLDGIFATRLDVCMSNAKCHHNRPVGVQVCSVHSDEPPHALKGYALQQ